MLLHAQTPVLLLHRRSTECLWKTSGENLGVPDLTVGEFFKEVYL